MQTGLTEGMLEANFGMPGLRPVETRWLLLPDWHYELPFNKAPLEDANVSVLLFLIFRHAFV